MDEREGWIPVLCPAVEEWWSRFAGSAFLALSFRYVCFLELDFDFRAGISAWSLYYRNSYFSVSIQVF
jgi:hypothetical protein